MKLNFYRKLFRQEAEEAPLTREQLYNVGVNKLIRELERCCTDEQFTRYKKDVVRELKRRVRRNNRWTTFVSGKVVRGGKELHPRKSKSTNREEK